MLKKFYKIQKEFDRLINIFWYTQKRKEKYYEYKWKNLNITKEIRIISSKLSVLTNVEHYFHTEEQLKYYKNWINKTI